MLDSATTGVSGWRLGGGQLQSPTGPKAYPAMGSQQSSELAEQQSGALGAFQTALGLAPGGSPHLTLSPRESENRRDSAISSASTECADPLPRLNPHLPPSFGVRESVGKTEQRAMRTFSAPVKFSKTGRTGSFQESSGKLSRKGSLVEQAQRDAAASRKQADSEQAAKARRRKGSFRQASPKEPIVQMSEQERRESVHNLLFSSMNRVM